MAKGRASPHFRLGLPKKRHRTILKLIDALRFRNEKEQGLESETAMKSKTKLFSALKIKERLDGIEERIGNLEANFLEQGEHLKAMLVAPWFWEWPKRPKSSVFQGNCITLIKVFKRYKLSTFNDLH